MTNFNIITLLPKFFETPLSQGLMEKARKNGLINFSFYNPHDYSLDKNRRVDDKPFGGGPGMVLQVQPVLDAIKSIKNPGRILLLCPAGKKLDTNFAKELSHEKDITLICGRYEGIDARLADFVQLEPICTGETILNGGETAALVAIESIARFLDGFMGKNESADEETFSQNLLEYPHYTRPQNYNGSKVPDVLLQGNHAQIAKWRKKESILKTYEYRKDLLNIANLDEFDAETLRSVKNAKCGRNLSFCLFHYPVMLETGGRGVSSLTNLDIHDISRISCSYGMGPFFVLTPLKDQLDLLNCILRHWTKGAGGKSNPDRAKALKLVQPVANCEELEKSALEYFGQKPVYVVASANWPKKNIPLAYGEILELCRCKPVIICLGTARGLDLKSLPFKFNLSRPVRFLNENHLSVRGAAAILADRILGDYN